MRELIDLLLILGLVMVLTNPDPQLHRATLDEAAAAAQAQSGTLERLAATVWGKAHEAPPTYQNYHFFSTMTSNGATVSIGAFAHVWKIRSLFWEPGKNSK